jgi:hypothetical protein
VLRRDCIRQAAARRMRKAAVGVGASERLLDAYSSHAGSVAALVRASVATRSGHDMAGFPMR